jgi:hypothetical protein
MSGAPGFVRRVRERSRTMQSTSHDDVGCPTPTLLFGYQGAKKKSTLRPCAITRALPFPGPWPSSGSGANRKGGSACVVSLLRACAGGGVGQECAGRNLVQPLTSGAPGYQGAYAAKSLIFLGACLALSCIIRATGWAESVTLDAPAPLGRAAALLAGCPPPAVFRACPSCLATEHRDAPTTRHTIVGCVMSG